LICWICIDASKSSACIGANSIKSGLVIRLDELCVDLCNNPNPKVIVIF